MGNAGSCEYLDALTIVMETYRRGHLFFTYSHESKYYYTAFSGCVRYTRSGKARLRGHYRRLLNPHLAVLSSEYSKTADPYLLNTGLLYVAVNDSSALICADWSVVLRGVPCDITVE